MMPEKEDKIKGYHHTVLDFRFINAGSYKNFVRVDKSKIYTFLSDGSKSTRTVECEIECHTFLHRIMRYWILASIVEFNMFNFSSFDCNSLRRKVQMATLQPSETTQQWIKSLQVAETLEKVSNNELKYNALIWIMSTCQCQDVWFSSCLIYRKGE